MRAFKRVLCLLLSMQIFFAPLSGAETLPYSLVDKSKYTIFEQDRQQQDAEELIIQEAPDDAQLLKYTEEFWRQAVTAVDGAYNLDKDPEPIPDLTLLNPTLSLPLYGTNVALTGRYVIGLKLDGKQFKEQSQNESEERNTNNFEFQQELQLKMQGKILDRVFVDIDYDDKREEEKTLSVAYRGRTGEVVQSAEFGDIDLSLPETEFIAYQKQLFGAKMHLQYKDFDLRLIGSQTKGSSKQKQFIGGSVFEIVNLRDIDYIRRTYYDLTFGNNIHPTESSAAASDWKTAMINITPNSEEVYLDSSNNGKDFVPIEKTATDYLDPTATRHTAKFKLLQRGVDYTVDYTTGVIQFRSALNASDVVAVDYQNSMGIWLNALGGTPGTIKLIKTENEKSIGSSALESANKLEIKTRYNIGAQQITRDDGKGNFLLHLLDANGEDAGYSASPMQVYPTTIEVDFDKGVFELNSRMTDDVGLYYTTPTSSKNRTFKVEYTSKVKTYFIESGIVIESEVVLLNGLPLTRNKDYYIDYASGFITFYQGDRVTETSVINITYDTETGSSSNNSLLGGRLDYNFMEKIRVGATMLKEGWDKPDSVPQVGNYSKDLMVYGADINGKDLKVTDALAVDFSAEVAQSKKEQNLFGYAMVESMNEANVQVSGSRNFKEWRIAANPNGKSSFLDSIRWDTQDVPALEINPYSISAASEKQQVITINYDFTKPMSDPQWHNRDEVSIVFPLSDSGVDLSDKSSFELSMFGDGPGAPQVNFTFGEINELSDNSNGMQLACSNYYPGLVPKTEDINCRGSLAPNEDIGWVFINPDGHPQQYNPFTHNIYNYETQPNGRIDTQDLNNNGKLDLGDPMVGGDFGYNGTQIDGLIGNTADYNGWRTFVTPMNISPIDKSRWTAVRHLRITLKKGAKPKGTIKIANVGVSGTAWTPLENTSPTQLAVSSINNVDNSNYVPIFSPNSGDGYQVFSYLYGSLANYGNNSNTGNVMDQALNLKFNTTSLGVGQELYATRNFRTMDFTQHQEIRFLLHGSGHGNDGSEFFLKIGTDLNYEKVIIPTGFDNWRLIRLKMVDTDGDSIADSLENLSEATYKVRVEPVRAPSGVMNFKKVSSIVAGIQRDATVAMGSSGDVWLNVIHLAEDIVLEGNAYKGDVTVRLDGWGSAGAKYKYMDSNFETPLSVSKNQEVTEEEYFVNIDRVKNFPMSANFARSTTITPNIVDTTDYNTVSTLDKGKVERELAQVRGDFIKENMPKIGLEYTMDQVDYELLKRKDKAQTYGILLTHETQKSFKNVTAGYYYTDTAINYDRSVHGSTATTYNTEENTQRMNMKVTYQPSDKFNFVPSYSLSKSKEERTQYAGTDAGHTKYPKAMRQSAGFTSTLKINSWLAPSVSYNILTTENANLNEKRVNFGGQLGNNYTAPVGSVKSINRNADGGLSLTLNGNEIIPKSKLLRNLVISSSYRIQDADAWADVDSGFDSKQELWIRNSMKSVGMFGYRTSLILRDTINSSLRWSPLSDYQMGGRWEALKTISILNNFNKTMQENDQTGTIYDSESMTLPDLVFSISDLEKLISASRWLNASNLKIRYSEIEQKNQGIDKILNKQYGGDFRFMLVNYFDTVLTYNHKTADKDDMRAGQNIEDILEENFSAQTSFYVRSMRITPKLTYTQYEKRLYQNTLSESSEELVPSLNLRLDFNLPRGIRLPFLNRMYTATNRIIWNTNISYTDRTSPIEVKDNYKLFDINTSLDYEISQNLRFNIAGGVQLMKNEFVKTEDYTAYNVAANLTIQF